MSTVMDFTRVHVLRNEEEYDAAIEVIEQLLDADPAPGTEEYEHLELLSVLAEDYERKHYPVEFDQVTPQQIVEFVLEQKGMKRGDLSELLGGKSRVSEFFSGNRPLSINQVRVLRDRLGIPADLLITPPSER